MGIYELAVALMLVVVILLSQLWSYSKDIVRFKEIEKLQDKLLGEYRELDKLNKESHEFDAILIKLLKESIEDKDDFIMRLKQHITDLQRVLNDTR